jgi:hypothetical protein
MDLTQVMPDKNIAGRLYQLGKPCARVTERFAARHRKALIVRQPARAKPRRHCARQAAHRRALGQAGALPV